MRGEAAAEVARLGSAHGVTPKLSVVLAGDDPASAVYVRNKDRACREAGIASDVVRLPDASHWVQFGASSYTLYPDPAEGGEKAPTGIMLGFEELAELSALLSRGVPVTIQ